jgi:hypothetical protein
MDKVTEKTIGTGKRGPGRPKGSVNKVTGLLREAILAAAEQAGGEGGTVAYLRRQADEHPAAFMSLLARVLPTQLVDEKDEELQVVIFKTTYEDNRLGVPPVPMKLVGNSYS